MFLYLEIETKEMFRYIFRDILASIPARWNK